jgi:tetratricopeptide (TPR) repeat protein
MIVLVRRLLIFCQLVMLSICVSANEMDEISWLANNQAHPEFAQRLESTLSGLKTVSQARSLARVLPSLLIAPQELERVATAVANILLTARRFTEAAELYTLAFESSGATNSRLQFRIAQLALHAGELSRADRLARDVLSRTDDYELKRRSYALIARALHAAGRHEEARQMLTTLLALEDPALVEPETLVLMERVERALGNQFSAIATLGESHPESVAALISEHPQVLSAALPLRLMEFFAPAEESPDLMGTAIDRAAVTVSGIQVGSFTDPDNAFHMRRDIEGLGLEAEVRTQTREARTTHTVVVVIEGGSSQVVDAMEQLQRAGFDGFLVY